jgi:hypothetical protein
MARERTLERAKKDPGGRDLLNHPDDQLLVRTRSVVSRMVGGETLVVPVRGKVGDLASIYSFNGVGSFIWQSLEEPTSLADLVAAVEHEYAVSQDRARKDVMRFVEDLLSVGLVQPYQSAAVIASETNIQSEWVPSQ